MFISIAVFAVYGQVVSHEFILYDDQTYITENPNVLGGISPKNIQWAFTAFHDHNWFPLTWLSYMLQIQIFGQSPSSLLLGNVVLHAMNSMLLFLLMERSTGYFWRSAVAALLFALHPLHVESVAWVSERKDVLSAFFGILTLHFYRSYAEKPGGARYVLTLITYLLGLMSKPMLVSIPILLLLLDYWPLKRRAPAPPEYAVAAPLPEKIPHMKLILEKLPFVLLAAISCVITILAQTDVINPLDASPFSGRVANALNVYVIYLYKTLVPISLAPFYPFPQQISPWPPVASAILLAFITVLSFRLRKSHPYLITGWLWYLAALVPVIGIVKVGGQSMADRYTYIPHIGVFVMLVWGGTDAWRVNFRNTSLLAGATAAILGICSLLSWQQAARWKNTATLFSHTEAVTGRNHVTANVLALDRIKSNNLDDALELLEQSISIAPNFVDPRYNKAVLLRRLGRTEEAIITLKQAVELAPGDSTLYFELGDLLITRGALDEAAGYLSKGLDLAPESGAAHYNLALVRQLQGKHEEAILHYGQSLHYNSEFPNSHNNMGISLMESGRPDEAIRHFREALRLRPAYTEAQKNLEQALGGGK